MLFYFIFILLSVFIAILMILLYMFLILLCIPTEYEAREVRIWKVDFACGWKLVGVKRALTSCDSITGILD